MFTKKFHNILNWHAVIISIINRSKYIQDAQLQHVIRAINRQIYEDFAPYWSFSAQLRLEGKIGKKTQMETIKQALPDLRGDAILYLWDEVNLKDAESYHESNARGIPYGFVFIDISDKLKESWSVTLSHEALELLGDAQINMLVQGPHPTDPEHEVFHWFEMCDAVQAQSYKIDEVDVSNFVLPLYFTPDEQKGGRNDFLGILNKGKGLASFGVAQGGYVGFYDPVKRAHEQYYAPNDKVAKQRLAIKKAAYSGRGYKRKHSNVISVRKDTNLNSKET